MIHGAKAVDVLHASRFCYAENTERRCCWMAKLTAKQQRFCDEYLIDLNATQAAIRAGYKANKKNTFEVIGYQLLQKTSVLEKIQQEMAKRSKRTGINQDRVIQELARIAFVNASDVIDPEDASVRLDATEDDLACIQSVKVKTMDGEKGSSIEREVKLNDKMKALELLGKHLGMFKDKIELESDMELNINIDYGD